LDRRGKEIRFKTQNKFSHRSRAPSIKYMRGRKQTNVISKILLYFLLFSKPNTVVSTFPNTVNSFCHHY
jgi:hypothetical protein